jgi:hypothetical protein
MHPHHLQGVLTFYFAKVIKIIRVYIYKCRSQWRRALRCRFAAARLLRLWVRIPPWAWMFVCCECCVLSLPRADHSSRGVLPTVVRRYMWSRKPQEREGHDPRWVAAPHQEKSIYISCEVVGLDNKLYKMHGTYVKIVMYNSYKNTKLMLLTTIT